MIVKLLTEHHLQFLSLKEGCTGSSESRLGKMPHCWKSHVAAQIADIIHVEGLYSDYHKQTANSKIQAYGTCFIVRGQILWSFSAMELLNDTL